MMDINSIIRGQFVQTASDAPLSEVLGKLGSAKERTAVIFKQGKCLGVLDTQRMLRTHLETSKAKVETFLLHVPAIQKDAELLYVAGEFFEARSEILPVYDGKKVVGVVDAMRLLQMAIGEQGVAKLVVKDIPLVKVSKLKKDDAIASAGDLMYKEGVDHLPVFDKGQLFGVLSQRDIFQKYLLSMQTREVSTKFTKIRGTRGESEDKLAFPSLPVVSFCTRENIVQVSSKALLRDALALMQRRGVEALAVYDQNEYQGILVMRSILRVLKELKKEELYTVQYIGFNTVDLTDHQRDAIQDIIQTEARKLQQKIKEKFLLILHLKEIGKDSRKKEYAVTLKLEYPGEMLSTTHEDWDLETALHKCFNFNAQKKGDVARNLAKKRTQKRET